jgi:DNA mismatch repair protein MutL
LPENRINILSRETAELIAAGEVIERPASIAKELIENAADAGAKKITVEIQGGGVSYLRVTDDGCGIAAEDVPKAFLRHATSKIKDKSDLAAIFTLGFRGEALASICAVSDVEMFTKTRDESFGTHYKLENGASFSEKSGCPNGTTIIIRDVFKNIPARLKFLKKNVSEGNAVAEIVRKTALSRPEIAFSFIRDGNNEFNTSGGGLFPAIHTILGKQFAASLIPVDYDFSGIKLSGFVSSPLFGRANRAFQNFFINGRYVKSYVLLSALEEAYRNSIMTGKFPAAVLHLSLRPEIIDVNAHPTKLEVKFSDDKLIYDAVYLAAKNALLSADKPAELNIKSERKNTIEYSQNNSYINSENLQNNSLNQVKFDYKLPEETAEIITEAAKETAKTAKENTAVTPVETAPFKYLDTSSFVKSEVTPLPKAEELPLKIVGEAFETFILAQTGDELFVIDKHAAHERILYENLKNGAEKLSCQYLMNYRAVSLEGAALTAAQTEKETVSALGFDFSADGAECILMGIPSVLTEDDGEAVFVSLLDSLSRGGLNTLPEIIDDIYHSIACKAAIKARDRTSVPEMRTLAARVLSDEKIRFCPHGRPVVFTIKRRELERNFKRVT